MCSYANVMCIDDLRTVIAFAESVRFQRFCVSGSLGVSSFKQNSQ